MDIRLLGPIEASLDGRPVALGAPQQRAVLAMLALQVNQTVSADRLSEGLWGERAPATAPKMVQLYVSQLRKLLRGSDGEILTRGRGYELRLAVDRVDAARFERLVAAAVQADGAPNGEARAALALWRGSPLADVARRAVRERRDPAAGGAAAAGGRAGDRRPTSSRVATARFSASCGR